jgi:hypothetical protein
VSIVHLVEVARLGRLLVGLLLLASVVTNVVLLLRWPDTGERTESALANERRPDVSTPVPARAQDENWSRTPVGEGGSALAERVALLEQRLAEAEKDAARFKSIDPTIVAIYSSLPLRDKLLAILDLDDETKVWDAFRKLSEALAKDPTNQRLLLDLLTDESDPRVLGALERLLQSGALGKPGPEMVDELFDVAATGDTAERRRAAIAALPVRGFPRDDEIGTRFESLLKQERDPKVVGYALKFFDWFPGKLDSEWLTELVEKSTDATVRSQAAIALARSNFASGLDSVLDRVEAARSEEVRSAWMDGVARALNSGGAPPGKDLAHRLLVLLPREPRLRTRQDLIRGAMFGMDRGPQGGGWLQFLKDYLPLEPNAEQQRALGELIALLESGKSKGSADVDPLIYRAK